MQNFKNRRQTIIDGYNAKIDKLAKKDKDWSNDEYVRLMMKLHVATELDLGTHPYTSAVASALSNAANYIGESISTAPGKAKDKLRSTDDLLNFKNKLLILARKNASGANELDNLLKDMEEFVIKPEQNAPKAYPETVTSAASYDFEYKVLVVGSSKSGRSSLIRRFGQDTFSEFCIATSAGQKKDIQLSPHNIRLDIFDNMEITVERGILQEISRGAHAIVLCVDMASDTHLKDTEDAIRAIERCAAENVPIVIAVTKSDLPNQNADKLIELQKLATDARAALCQTSAKNGMNVNIVFKIAATMVATRNGDIGDESILTNLIKQGQTNAATTRGFLTRKNGMLNLHGASSSSSTTTPQQFTTKQPTTTAVLQQRLQAAAPTSTAIPNTDSGNSLASRQNVTQTKSSPTTSSISSSAALFYPELEEEGKTNSSTNVATLNANTAATLPRAPSDPKLDEDEDKANTSATATLRGPLSDSPELEEDENQTNSSSATTLRK